MTPEELKAKQELLDEIKAEVSDLISGSTNGLIKSTEVEAKVKSINEKIEKLEGDSKLIKELKESIDAQNTLIEKLEKAAIEQGTELTKLKNGVNAPAEKMTFREAIKQAILEKKDIFLAEKNDDNGKRLSAKDYFTEKGNKTSPVFTVKAAVDMLQSNIIGNYAQYMRMAELDPMRVSIPLVIYQHVLSVLPQKQLNRPTMSLLVVYTYWDGSGTKTEGSASGQSSFLLKTVEFKAFNIATYFSLSDETLDDLEEALDEISIVAPDKILSAIDAKILTDGGNGTTDIQGILVGGTTCTDFTAATYATTVIGANIIDLLSKMKLVAENANYMPNAVILNGTDIESFQGLKDQLDNSILDRRVAWSNIGEPVAIAGMRIIKNNSMTANTALVLDTNQVQLGVRKAMTLEIGLNGTDFTEGQKTVRLGMRIAVGVRDKAALIYSSNIATDVDTITKVPA